MNFNRIQAAEVKLFDFSTYFWNIPRRCNISAIFRGCKNDNFQMKNCDILLIFAQTIDVCTHDLYEMRKKNCMPL